MRNYVREMDFIIEKKNPPANFCLFLSGVTFFAIYSGIMLEQEYYQFLLFLIILALLSVFYANFIFSLSKDEEALWNEIQEAREFLEKLGEKDSNVKVNALVSLFRSRRKEMGWSEMGGMLSDREYVEKTLHQAASKERKKAWEKQL